MAPNSHWITTLVRDIPDYPETGVTFRDITPLLGDGEGFHRAITELVQRFEGLEVDRVLGGGLVEGSVVLVGGEPG